MTTNTYLTVVVISPAKGALKLSGYFIAYFLDIDGGSTLIYNPSFCRGRNGGSLMNAYRLEMGVKIIGYQVRCTVKLVMSLHVYSLVVCGSFFEHFWR